MHDDFRNVPGFEGHYQVSRSGKILSLKRNKLLALVLGKNGYYSVNLYKEGAVTHVLVHRIVAAAFLGAIPPGMVVNHKDGDKLNNRADNLEVITPLANREHAEAMGLVCAKGEKNVRAKLTERKVRAMRSLRERGVKVKDIAARFEVSQRSVYLICNREAWKHVA